VTPEQAKADDALHAAIDEHARVWDVAVSPGALLQSWAVVSVWLPPDDGDEQKRTGYGIQLRGDFLPAHELYGLGRMLCQYADESVVDEGEG
jgi:hypothetical protein